MPPPRTPALLLDGAALDRNLAVVADDAASCTTIRLHRELWLDGEVALRSVAVSPPGPAAAPGA